MAAIEKGFLEQALEGPLTEHPMCGVRFVLEDGASHQVRNFPSIFGVQRSAWDGGSSLGASLRAPCPCLLSCFGWLCAPSLRGSARCRSTRLCSCQVDSSELAFKIAGKGALRQACESAGAIVLEPVMSVTVTAPEEFQGVCVSLINKRKGMIDNSDTMHAYVTIECMVPLANMFGFSTDLRSSTQVQAPPRDARLCDCCPRATVPFRREVLCMCVGGVGEPRHHRSNGHTVGRAVGGKVGGGGGGVQRSACDGGSSLGASFEGPVPLPAILLWLVVCPSPPGF